MTLSRSVSAGRCGCMGGALPARPSTRMNRAIREGDLMRWTTPLWLLTALALAGCDGTTIDLEPDDDTVGDDDVADDDDDTASDDDDTASDDDDDSTYTDEDGDGWSVEAGDCDDNNAAVFPDAPEICDGLDDNCNGVVPVDETDADADGWMACEGDCDDGEAAVHPGSSEVCDGMDNDCDPNTDEALDGDGDGLSVCDGDCDDTNSTVSPAATETCDGIDNDCDGTPDDDCVDCDVLVPSGAATIGDAISTSADGDVICVEHGIYLEVIDLAGKAVHVLGLAGAEATVLDASYSDTAVTAISGEGADTILEDLTILRGNSADSGGGIRIEGSSPTLIGLVVDTCRADNGGGGIYLSNSSTRMTDVVVRDSFAGVDGGGVFAIESDLVMERVTVEGCEAIEDGGGLFIEQSEVDFTDGTIEDNFAGWAGGGGKVLDWSELDMADSQVIENAAGVYGGGLDVQGPNVLQMSDTRVEGNVADFGFANDGGGIRLVEGSTGFITYSTFTENVAGGDGGGIYIEDGLVHLEHCDFTENRADAGGGLFGHESTLEMTYVGFRGNTASSNGTSSDGGGMELSWGSNARVDNCVFEDNRAEGDGGGIATASEITGYHNRIAGNTATQRGGGVFADETSVYLGSTILLGNAASTGGGIHAEGESDLTLRYSNVVANTADEGGGILLDAFADLDFTLTLVNVTDNEATLSGGGVVCVGSCISTLTESNLMGNTPQDVSGLEVPEDSHSLDPLYVDTTSGDPTEWDLHLATTSPLVDLASYVWTDPDGSHADIGAYGSSYADEWDLDGDGWPEWWFPGEYDYTTYPGQGWDCDDRDDTVFPGSGC